MSRAIAENLRLQLAKHADDEGADNFQLGGLPMKRSQSTIGIKPDSSLPGSGNEKLYYDALEIADTHLVDGKIDASELENMLTAMFAANRSRKMLYRAEATAFSTCGTTVEAPARAAGAVFGQ